MSNKKGDSYIVNFKLIKDHRSKKFEYWKILLMIYMFYYSLHNKVLAIGHKTLKPLYACFNNTIFRTIGRFYRLTILLVVLVPTLRIGLEYNPVWWWWLCVVLGSILTLPALIFFIYDCSCKIRKKAHDLSITTDKFIVGRSGQPGGGKTSSLLYDLKVLADKMWKYICNMYKLLEPYIDDIPFWERQAREDALEIIEAYKFYKSSKYYPCLWTSTPVFVDGVSTHRITADHLMQRMRLPYGAVGFLDEVSLILPQELFHDKPIELRELCKFPRHILDLHLGTTEQGKDNMLIDLRRSMAENKNMIKQKWVLKPRFLIWLFDFILEHKKKLTKRSVTVLRLLGRTYNCIGWRKYYYYDTETMSDETVSRSRTKTFILPTFLNCDYNNRAFKHIYRCENEPLASLGWSSERLSSDEITEIFTKELEERAKGKKAKKQEAEAKRKNKEAAEKQAA